MTDSSVKLSYIAALFRVKVELTREACLAAEAPPEDLIKRARAKLQSILANGDIDQFIVHEAGFYDFWRAMREASDLRRGTRLSYVLAEGSPALSGISVNASFQDKVVAVMTIDSVLADIHSWRIEWLCFYVNHLIRQLGGMVPVNPAQIHGAWLKAASGERIASLPLAAMPEPSTEADKRDRPYSLIGNKARGEVTLIIRDLKGVLAQMSVSAMVELVVEAAHKVASQYGGQYQILRKDVAAAITAATTGPEIIGLNLPLVILGAVATKRATGANAGALFRLDYPGAGRLNINVSSDSLEATIGSFDLNLYRDPSFKVNEEWLRQEMRRAGLDLSMVETQMRGLINAVTRGATLEGMLIAAGEKSRGARDPYLHISYLDNPAAPVESAGDVLDIRNRQQRQIVHCGQLVAELRYHQPGVVGKDVYGNELPPADAERLPLTLGEGIEERQEGRFYAAFDGIPQVDERSLGLSKMMLHKGDVNLRSGNISFEGPVEISGSIDSGAHVEVTGDLVVKGSIRGAFVRCGGRLEVHSGITTGEEGLVIVKSDIRAEFIENSKIQCGGSLYVKKAILNSDVIAGGAIEVNANAGGLIAGGTISCRQNLSTAGLGFKNGSSTILNVGVDWRAELAVRIREGRLSKLKDLQIEDRKALRELLGRHKGQMTAKLEAKKESYQARLVRLRVLLEKLQLHLDQAKAQLVFDQDTIVFVAGIAFANIQVRVGGNLIQVGQDMAGVAFLGRAKGGSKIVAIESVTKTDDKAS